MKEYDQYLSTLNGNLLDPSAQHSIFNHENENHTLWITISKNANNKILHVGVKSKKFNTTTPFILGQQVNSAQEVDNLLKSCTPLNDHFNLFPQ